MLTRKLCLSTLLLLGLTTTVIASGYSTGAAFRHYSHIAGCGTPISGVTWVANHAYQKFQRCTLRATYQTVGPTRTPTPRPTVTPLPSNTATPLPSNTVTPLPTPTAWTWPTPIPTATQPTPSTPEQYLLNEINAERASHGYAPLILDSAMSSGTSSCMGAIGHARSMAQQGTIGHWDFPGDVCGYPGVYFTAGENVGVSGGSETQAIDSIQQGMLSEPWSPGCSGNHHCNEDSPSYTHIGIGIVAGTYGGWPAYYVSEEFAG